MYVCVCPYFIPYDLFKITKTIALCNGMKKIGGKQIMLKVHFKVSNVNSFF